MLGCFFGLQDFTQKKDRVRIWHLHASVVDPGRKTGVSDDL